jgi:Reverse transcriptase (RNA-dependent DNA polymerase)
VDREINSKDEVVVRPVVAAASSQRVAVTQAGQSFASSNPNNRNWLGYRTPDQWAAMDGDVVDHVLRERERNPRPAGRGGRGRGRGRGGRTGGRGFNPGRTVAGVAVYDDQTAMSGITHGTGHPPALPPAIGLAAVNVNAGDAFAPRTRQRTGDSPSVHFDPSLSAFSTFDRSNAGEGGRMVTAAAVQRIEEMGDLMQGRVEIDNHADTHALGRNCLVIYETGRTCSVSPYTSSYAPMTSVPIVTAATAYDNPETGETIILVFNESVYLGNVLENTLLNPNQARVTGIQICDDPFDPHRHLGIHDPATGISIPLEMSGSFAALVTRLPSLHEIEHCRRIILSSPQPWDPERLLTGREANRANYSVSVTSIISRARHSAVSDESLAKRWRISIPQAKATFKVTDQSAVRYAKEFLGRRYPLHPRILGRDENRIKHIWLYTDTMHAKTRSCLGNKYAQVFSTYDNSFVYVLPIERKSHAGGALATFIAKVGVPAFLWCDGSMEQTAKGSDFQKEVQHHGIQMQVTEPYTPRQNRAENAIGILRRKWRYRVSMQRVPKRLWDYALIWEAELLTRTARTAEGRTGYELIVGRTPDISEWLDFSFYDWVWYWYQPGDDDNPRLGRWLSVAENIGGGMTYWILGENGNVNARSTVQHVTELDKMTHDMQARFRDFDSQIDALLDPTNFTSFNPDFTGEYLEDYYVSADDVEAPTILPEEYTPAAYDQYIGAELWMPDHGQMVLARVTKRARAPNGDPIGVRNEMPLLDTRLYDVELDDGGVRRYPANLVAEHLSSFYDEEGRQHDVFRGIIDWHFYPQPVPMYQSAYDRQFINSSGWYFCVEWVDNSVSWLPMHELKEACPVLLAEYAKANNLLDYRVFDWWAPQLLDVKMKIMSKVKTKRYWTLSHKFGVRLPKTVPEAFEFDQQDGNDLWLKAIEKEMLNVRPAFSVFVNGTLEEVLARRALVGYTRINCHMVFGIKMETLVRKARLVAGGHMTGEPETSSYSSVVTRESVRIGFLLAAVDGVRMLSCDIGNTYLNADTNEKVYTIAGPEFGGEQGQVMIIKKALYGLKTSGKEWRELFAGTLSDFKFRSTYGDPDVWLRGAVHSDQHRYYERLLVYVDDILAISEEPEEIMKMIAEAYRLKEGSVMEPKIYLGADISKIQMADGRECWAMSAEGYVRSAVANIDKQLKLEGYKALRTRAANPFRTGYRPEVDVTTHLPVHAIRFYQGLIGIARWAIELGRIDIAFEISRLSSFNHAPREGHLDALLDIFAYLKRHPKASIVFDDEEPNFEGTATFVSYDWKGQYPFAKELIHPDMPRPLGRRLVISCFVDADFAE